MIFICQHDKFGENKPIYHVDKVVRETGKPYDDGAYTIYVNGTYKGDDDFGRLAHDFNCKKADDIYYGPLAEGVRHFKETEKGRDIMCESVKKYAEDYKTEDKIITVQNLMTNMKWTLDETLNNMGVSDEDERANITKQLQKQ